MAQRIEYDTFFRNVDRRFWCSCDCEVFGRDSQLTFSFFSTSFPEHSVQFCRRCHISKFTRPNEAKCLVGNISESVSFLGSVPPISTPRLHSYKILRVTGQDRVGYVARANLPFPPNSGPLLHFNCSNNTIPWLVPADIQFGRICQCVPMFSSSFVYLLLALFLFSFSTRLGSIYSAIYI